MEYLAGYMFLAMSILIMFGFHVTFTLGGTAIVFGAIGFGWDFFNLLPLRVWGRMSNVTLMAVPLFVFMGVMLERSGLYGLYHPLRCGAVRPGVQRAGRR